jgi:methionyl-tRNA synthetase
VVANLEPAKLMGRESNGMILAVDDTDGNVKVIEVDDKVEIGTRVR